MKRKKHSEQRVRGWLPKEPTDPHVSRLVTAHSHLLQFGGLLLPTLGAVLIAVFCYSTLLVFYDVQVSSSVLWLLLFAYVSGIALAIVGVTLRLRLTPPSTPTLRKPIFVAGFSLLTISLFGYIFDRFLAALNTTYPYSVHSLLVRLLIIWRTGWISILLWCLGFTGWILLLISGKIRLKMSNATGSVKIGHYALAIGAVTTFAGALLTLFRLLPPEAIPTFFQVFLYLFYAFAEPFGILCLTLGWAIVGSVHSRRRSFLLPALYGVFLVVTTISFLIPI